MTPEDLDIMARTLWGEARGEPLAGKVAIAHVINNRFKKPGWWSRNPDQIQDDTISAVCRDPYQFSCWNDNDPNKSKLLAVKDTDTAFRDCLLATAGVLSGNFYDPTNGANHYHTKSVAPKWAAGQTPVAYVGNHIFYRL